MMTARVLTARNALGVIATYCMYVEMCGESVNTDTSCRECKMCCAMWGAIVAAALALLAPPMLAKSGRSQAPSGRNPYAILGVKNSADKQTITKAYRELAKEWHPDRNGDQDATAIFATISHAYDVLMDAEKREVYDRLGERGLRRLIDGDPSVRKDWLPPEEILRRLHNDGEEAWVQSLVTSSFASLGALMEGVGSRVAWFHTILGISPPTPAVVITASEDATGALLASGGQASGDVTFKFVLSGKSFDFERDDITHGCAKAQFLGMKTTFYLQCAHVAGQAIAVSVAANAFTVAGQHGSNTPSAIFRLTMI